MRINTGLTVLAGAVALACSGGAFAQTNAGANGTVFVNVVDTTNSTSFLFDTGLSVAQFADPTSVSINLATNSASEAAYAAFVAGESNAGGVPDAIDYSVVGTVTPASGTPTYISDVTAVSKPTTTVGSKGADLAGQMATFLGSVNNALGGATYNGASAVASSTWNGGGYEPTAINDLGGVSDNALVGTALNFYAVTTTNASASRGGASVSTFTGTWDLTSAGLLTYAEPGGGTSPVPLPTPLLLMLSGLGLLGLVGRRKQSPDFNGAVA